VPTKGRTGSGRGYHDDEFLTLPEVFLVKKECGGIHPPKGGGKGFLSGVIRESVMSAP